MKLNVLLAMTDTLRTKYKNMVDDYTKFFTKSQGAFKGIKGTYEQRDGTVDDPSKRGVVKVVTTVEEKLEYFQEESIEFINALFSQERTNAMGLAQAELFVDGYTWGTFTSLELLRLKSLLESSDLGSLERMLSAIPVRQDSQVWEECSDPEYSDRDVWQTPLLSGVSKTTVKESYILDDPNVQSGHAKTYTPQIGVKNITQELGDWTQQNFSGEWSHKERAMTLKRRNDLIVAVVKALKECNECESVTSDLTANRIFNYIFHGSK